MQKRFLVLLAMVVLVPALASAATNKAAAPKDTTPPKLLALTLRSNGASTTLAELGNRVTITFTTNEKVTPHVLVDSKVLLPRLTNTGGFSWEASFTVEDRYHNGKVDYAITLQDEARNIFACSSLKLLIIPQCKTTDGSSVTIAVDTVPPVISGLTARAAVTDSAAGVAVAYTQPTALDTHDGPVPVACTPASGSVFALGTTTVACSAHDAAGNTASGSFTVTVTRSPDTTPPVLSVVSDISVVSPFTIGTPVSYATPTATDDRDGAVPVICAPASGAIFALGTTTVTCSAQDTAGNGATTTFAVGVTRTPDTTPPVIEDLVDIALTASQLTGTTSNYAVPTAQDARDGSVPVTCTPPPGSLFPIGTTAINCNATDLAGNTATGSFTIVVTYVQPPSVLMYEFWPTQNGVGVPGLTISPLNSSGSNTVLLFTPSATLSVTKICLAIDSYGGVETSTKLGIYSSIGASVDTLLTQSDSPFITDHFNDFFGVGEVTCFTFATPTVLTAGTQYAFGVDRAYNTTSDEDMYLYSKAGVNDAAVITGAADTFPGPVTSSTDKPYIKVYGF